MKVGDRVRCYGQNQNGWFDVINEEGDNGTITGTCGPAGVEVTMDNDYGEGRVCTFHPKQVRRLRKREKARGSSTSGLIRTDHRLRARPSTPGRKSKSAKFGGSHDPSTR